MKKNNIIRLPILLTIIFVYVCTTRAATKEPYDFSRLLWDVNSQTVLFESGNYSRIIELQDGRLMAVAETYGSPSGVRVSFSPNFGSSWTSPVVVAQNPSAINNAVPDAIQLADGTIIVGYNPRPRTPYSSDRHFGIRAVRSTDNGATWSDPIFIFDADYKGENGCWEPCFLELPSGEIHCYFADESIYTSSGEQRIAVCRSFDKGLTWSAPETVSFRAGCRDGMPVPIITDAGEIVVIIEDFGHSGYSGFRATTVRCTLEENWSNSSAVIGNDPDRQMIFKNPSADAANNVSAAPYLRRLGDDETIASWQGNYGRNGVGEGYFDMFVAVGDKDARNFQCITEPFGLSTNAHSLWNSVSYIRGDNSVMAIGSIGDDKTGNAINMIKGRPLRYIEANYGTPNLDGTVSTADNYTFRMAQQILMANSDRKRTTADFLYDNQYLYLTARVVDTSITSDKSDNDGVYLSLDMNNACNDYPLAGMYHIFFNIDGSVELRHGENVGTAGGGKWVKDDDTSAIILKTNVKSVYYDIEAAIPWSVLGLKSAPDASQTIRANVAVRNRRASDIEYITIPACETVLPTGKANSYSWPQLRLGVPSGVETPSIAKDSADIAISAHGGVLCVEASSDIRSVEVFSLNGTKIASERPATSASFLKVPTSGIGIVAVTMADGSSIRRKIVFHK